MKLALEEFVLKYPDVSVQIVYGNHRELNRALYINEIDIALNEGRKLSSDEYISFPLTVKEEYIELSARNPISGHSSVTVEDLKIPVCQGPRGSPINGNLQSGICDSR